MTLLITVFAAIISTVVWYKKAPGNTMKTGMLCFMFWGASIMWFVDAIFEYIELGEKYFIPEISSLISDTFLGLSVVALGLTVWIFTVIIKDEKGIIKAELLRKK